MRLKDLFTVPTGQKVTGRHLRRVLISSICSILLCMTCLVSTTWAWFAVSIENTGNVIQITEPEVTVTIDGTPFTSGENLFAGEHEVIINRTVNQDDLQQKMVFFVILTIQSNSETPAIYKIAVSESSSVTIKTNGNCKLSWEASWFAPASADEISDGVIMVTVEDDTDPSTETTTIPSTEPSTEGTTPAAEPSSEPATEPSTETTVPPTTEAPTIPSTTEPFTEATTSPATEETTIPSGTESATVPDETSTPPTTDPSSASEETAAPTIIPTETTGPVTEPQGTTTPAETD